MAYDSPNEAEEAASLLALARQTHEAHVAAAKGKAEAILARAQEEADVILTNAREEFTWLEEKIAKHREFEARYRGAISTYLQDLLDEINQDDEFVAPASLSPVVEEVEEDSAFSVEDEPVAVEELEFFKEPEPIVAAEPEYYSEPEPVFEPVAEPAYEEPVAAEPEDEFTYSTPVAEEEPAAEVPVFGPQPFDAAEDEFTYETPVIEEVDEPAPTFAEGDAPVPSFETAPAELSDEYYGDDTSDDLPAVPDSIDSYGSGADEIEALNNEIQDHHPEDQEEIENFDSLISGEPKPATGSVAAQSDEADEEEADKGVRGFFGFKKN